MDSTSPIPPIDATGVITDTSVLEDGRSLMYLGLRLLDHYYGRTLM